MKVLLTAVNAKYIHSNLAVYDLRAYAEAYGTGGAQVEIGEYTINHTIDYIRQSQMCFAFPVISGIWIM